MLESPSFVDTVWKNPLAPAVQVRRMKHAYLDTVTVSSNQTCEEGGARWRWTLSSASQRIGQYGNFQARIVSKSFIYRCNQFMLSLANVKCRKVYSPFSTTDLALRKVSAVAQLLMVQLNNLECLIECGGPTQDLDLGGFNLKSWCNMVELSSNADEWMGRSCRSIHRSW